MVMKIRIIFLVLLAVFLPSSVYGSLDAERISMLHSKAFVNKTLDINHFEFFFQDSIGRIWAGSNNNGLMMFDGDTFVKKTPAIGTYGIHCVLPLTQTRYLVGSRLGLYRFDMRTLGLQSVKGFEKDEVVGLHRIGKQDVIVFCASRIVRIGTEDGNVQTLCSWNGYRVIQHLLLPDGSFLLLTNKEGVYSFDLQTVKSEVVVSKDCLNEDDLLLCMLHDQGILWLGSDRGLLRCDLHRKRVVRIPGWESISVKTFMRERSGSLWIGTNNGLYIMDTDGWTHYCHTTRDASSLLNDCVWGIFEDAEGNKWLGVDGGISFIPRKQYSVQVNWSDLIQTTEGNSISNILHDSHGNYWLGGNNGLGYYNASTGTSILFKMQGKYRIPNNRIRTLYEDKCGIVWVGTDGGLAWFDEKKKEFRFCQVADTASGRNAVWTYGMAEDNSGNLWMATCSGGILVAGRKELLDVHRGETVPAVYNYHSLSPGRHLPYNYCLGIIADRKGNIFVNADNWLYRIGSGPYSSLPADSLIAIRTDNIVSPLLCDEAGHVWGALRNALFRTSDEGTDIEIVNLEAYTKEFGEVNSLTSCGDYIWFLTSRGVGTVHKQTLAVRHLIELPMAHYHSCYYDNKNQCIWLGGIDKCLLIDPKECLVDKRTLHPASVISEIYVNGELVSPLKEVDGRFLLKEEAAYCSRLKLGSTENTVAFRISTGVLPREDERWSGYYYRIKEVDGTWNLLSSHSPLIEYSYLNYGTYHFEIGVYSEAKDGMESVRTIEFFIQPPWYHSFWFRMLMAGLLLGVFVAILNYYRIWTKWHVAEIDKRKSLALSQMKLEFLSNMSHELKTPLSLILAPVNKLLSMTRNTQHRELLQTVRANVLKLNELVVQIINFKEEDVMSSRPMLSRLEVVEFMQSIVLTYREICQGKGIEFAFESEAQPIFIEVDPLKLESVINNLLSNACKFTSSGGKITVGVRHLPSDALLQGEILPETVDAGWLELKVEDTGLGIPPEDLPRIFDRFYQSPQNQAANPDGSGIGLAMVRKYVNQHQGEVSVSSEVGKGTTFTLLFPIVQSEENSVPAFSNADSNNLRILIVEDNIEIARFIAENLPDMQCTIVHNGKAGVETALRLMPDLIVADIMMPIMDGLEMNRLLKRNLTTATIPVLLLTAKDNKQTELDAYKAGVDAFLSKPFEIEHLRIRIEQLLKSKSLLIRQSRKGQPSQQVQEEEAALRPLPLSETSDEKFLADITRLIEEHLEDSELNVQRLAELSGLNGKQIYRKLKLLTGTTAVDYIKSVRLKKAAMLLMQKRFTVAEVMYMVGFSNSSYFAKCFTEKYGKSPKAYMND